MPPRAARRPSSPTRRGESTCSLAWVIGGQFLELFSRGGETRRKLQRPLEVRACLASATLTHQREPEVEDIPMIRAVARDRRAKRLLGFGQTSVAPQRHAERVPRRRARRVDGDGVAKARERRVDMSEVALQL